uniref:Uncharacterized protein n=1 Tax=Panagrolaimus sp. JU765 TaxID=591449 RepID=A0AC34Q6E2_9BILA
MATVAETPPTTTTTINAKMVDLFSDSAVPPHQFARIRLAKMPFVQMGFAARTREMVETTTGSVRTAAHRSDSHVLPSSPVRTVLDRGPRAPMACVARLVPTPTTVPTNAPNR